MINLNYLKAKLESEFIACYNMTLHEQLPIYAEVYDDQNYFDVNKVYIASVKEKLPKEKDLIGTDSIFLLSDCEENRALHFPKGFKYAKFSCGLKKLINTYNAFVFSDNSKIEGFSECWERIMSKRLVSKQSIEEEFLKIPKKVSGYSRLTIFEFGDDSRVNYKAFISELETFFPDFNIIKFERIVLMLQCYPTRINRFSKEDSVFSELIPVLDKYNAYVIIGNATARYDKLRDSFKTSKRMLDIAVSLNGLSKNRIFYREDYCNFYMIEQFVTHYKKTEGFDDTRIISNPAVYRLWEYDRQNETDLMELVYNYIILERSCSLTSEKMFMHRNTVLSRIKKAESLMGVSLSNPDARKSILYSIDLYKYTDILSKDNL